MSADKGEGEWCQRCKMRHGYKSLRIQYEERKDVGWVIMWLCPNYLHVCGELPLKAYQAKQQQNREGNSDE